MMSTEKLIQARVRAFVADVTLIARKAALDALTATLDGPSPEQAGPPRQRGKRARQGRRASQRR